MTILSPLLTQPLSIQVVDCCYVSRFNFDRENRKLYGTVYDFDGQRIDLAVRVGGYGGDRILNDDPNLLKSRESNVRYISGTTVYLGNLMGQFGHFLTEGLSTFWALPNIKFETALFHPFIFGDEIKEFMKPIHEVFGLKHDHIVVTREPCCLEKALIPERAIVLNKSAHVAHRKVIRLILDSFTNDIKISGRSHIFVSRSRLEVDQRAQEKAGTLDIIMEGKGFTVLHPQELNVIEQIKIFQSATVLCGMSGSALHNSLFQRAGAMAIEIGDIRTRNRPHPMQEICNTLADIRAAHIPYKTTPSGEWDLDFVSDSVSAILNSL